MAEQSLKDKTVRGVGWSAADAFLGHGVTFIVGLILARLLSPEEYGLIGIVTIFTTILLGFIDCGFSNALIRKQDANDEDYNTMFVVNLFMSISMYVLLFFSASLIADFFGKPQLVSLVRVVGLLLIFMSLSIVQDTILKKKLDFKTKTKASVIAAVLSGITGIVMAFLGFGVWSLVIQLLLKQLLNTICLWFYNRWWPKWIFSIKSLHYMWGFGWKLIVSGFLERLWAQLYQTVVGKYYSPATLGQYTRAKDFASIFSSNLTSIVQRVSYPVLSQVQGDIERMACGYRRIIKTTMLLTSVVMLFMGAVAEPLIYCLIGPQWHIASTFLPLICISMSLYPLHVVNLNMLQIQGRTDIYLILDILKKIITIGPICLGIFVNIYWMLIGSIFTGIISFFLNSYYTGTSLGYSSLKQLGDVAPSYGIAAIVAFSVYFLKLLPVSFWIILPLQIIVGFFVFVITCEIMNLEEYRELKSMTFSFAKKLYKISN